jgi:hypothetical protein
MLIQWKRGLNEAWSGAAGPFEVMIEHKADGRWAWQIFKNGGRASASGVASSLGGAKNVTEGIVKRSGLV